MEIGLHAWSIAVVAFNGTVQHFRFLYFYWTSSSNSLQFASFVLVPLLLPLLGMGLRGLALMGGICDHYVALSHALQVHNR